MKWRVQPVPLGLNRPVWVVDCEFDVRNHLRHARLPHPGTKTQLCHMIGELAAERIPPDRPPWQLWFLEGFQGTKVVGVLKLNHAMADGGTCAELLDVLSRPEPNAPPVGLPLKSWRLFMLRPVGPRQVSRIGSVTSMPPRCGGVGCCRSLGTTPPQPGVRGLWW